MGENKKKTKKTKVIIISILMLIFSFNMLISASAKWYQDENGRRCGNSNTGFYISNQWTMMTSGNGVGRYYCFDKEGYLRTDQVTPDGYCVNKNGHLIVDDQVVKIYTYVLDERPSDEEWASGIPYIGRWIGLYTHSNGKSDSITEATSGSPFELRIFRNEDGKLYVEFYELKNGVREKIATYDFLQSDGKNYYIEFGDRKEMFYPWDYTYITSGPGTVDEEGTARESFDYYRIIE